MHNIFDDIWNNDDPYQKWLLVVIMVASLLLALFVIGLAMFI